jgi:hypothetical protein
VVARGRITRRFMRVGLGLFALAVSLTACSGGVTADSTPSTDGTHGSPPSRALNVTPCNYAQVWLNDPSHFSEFATLARFARVASNPDLRSQGRQLAAAVAASNASTVTAAMGKLASTCEKLGLVHSPPTTTTTTATH